MMMNTHIDAKEQSEMAAHRETTAADVAVVCSNCHRMLHAGGVVRTIKQLKAIIKSAKTRTK